MRKRKMSQAGGRAKKGRSTLTKRVATLERTRPKQQLKYIDTSINFDGTSTTTQAYRITAVAQGTGRSARIGNKILVKKVEFTWHQTANLASNVSDRTVEFQVFKATDTDDVTARSDTLGAFQDPEKFTIMHSEGDSNLGSGSLMLHRGVLTTNFGIQFDEDGSSAAIGKDLGVYYKTTGQTDIRVTGTCRTWFVDA